MGMEDIGVILRPCEPLTVSAVERQLLRGGFAAHISDSVSFPHESLYVLSDKEKNIEALLKGETDDPALTRYLSIRYAICQPESATQAFLDVVSQLVCTMPLQIEGIASGVIYSKGTLSEFRELISEKIVEAKSRWSSLFEQDTEEVVLSVAESWKYFIAKHPQSLRSEQPLAG